MSMKLKARFMLFWGGFVWRPGEVGCDLMSYAGKLLRAITGEPVILIAAGVIPVNQAGEILLLQRCDGVWDLPGGHMEPGEALAETAARELFEETGLSVAHLELLGVTSGKETFYPPRNAYYVTAIYGVEGPLKPVKLSHEHVAARSFALNALPQRVSVSVQGVVVQFTNLDKMVARHDGSEG